ncbi:glycosyltransferase family 87 protein [Novosphingobium aquimarinum]|uniref:glycosyltransferase family 87 protein n=1 Tax=Novosphingobium aquimarinum TaxID=2682494 RepID=UPI0012EBDB5B|nr:glycosyltransferase family 87 protein [Novosphingobium aquimarinum]
MTGGFFSTAAWLDRGRVRGYLLLLALLNALTLGFLLATSTNGVDRNGYLLGTDFLSFWTAGRMLAAGQDVYDQAAHIAAQRAYFVQQGEAFTAFFYPPSFLPLCRLLGIGPYFVSLAIWLLATGAFYAWSVSCWLRASLREHPSMWILLAAFPPVLITITHGQTAFLVAGLMGAATYFVPRRPVLAGVLFGLATIKPQFGPLVPLVLLLTGQWRVIAAAAASSLALALLATLAFGLQPWADWLALSAAAQAAMSQGSVGFSKMVSLFAGARLLGAPTWLAYALQTVLSAAVVMSIAAAAVSRGWSDALGAALLVGALLVTPFMLDYDLVLLAFPLIWLAGQDHRRWERLTILLAFAAPAFARPLALSIGVPILPPILLALFVVLLRRARQPRDDDNQHDGIPLSNSRTG